MITDISIHVSSISWGCEDIELIFGKTKINYSPTYMGVEPISSLLCVFAESIKDNKLVDNTIKWYDEPGKLEIDMMMDDSEDDLLYLDIKNYPYFGRGDNQDDVYSDEWHLELSFSCFKDAVIKEAIRLLKVYGIGGFNQNWLDGNDIFPINSLLFLVGNRCNNAYKDVYHSDILEELRILEELCR